MRMEAAVGAPDFLTVEETATVLRIGRTKAYDLARQFEVTGIVGIPVIRCGKQLRVPRRRLEELAGGPISWPLSASAVPDAVDVPARRAGTRAAASNRRASSPRLFTA
jgi:hypothetical protein